MEIMFHTFEYACPTIAISDCSTNVIYESPVSGCGIDTRSTSDSSQIPSRERRVNLVLAFSNRNNRTVQ